MVKIALLPLLFLTSLFGLSANRVSKEDYKSYLNVSLNERNNYTLNYVSTLLEDSEIRIYRYDDMLIDEIAANAFEGTSYTSVAISNCVKIIHADAFAGQSTLTTCYFTGSEEEWDSLYPNYAFQHVFYYAIDEGFINYWNKEVRPTENTNICEISTQTYQYVRELYIGLSAEDKAVVDAYTDLAGSTIKDSMKELNRHFATPDGAKKSEEWNQTGAIILIIIIAVIGMTSITVFFLLKTKQIID